MRIGDLARLAGMTTKTIRFYEQVGLVPSPPRSANGYRDYPPQVATRLRFVRDAQGAGLSLAEIRSILAVRDGGLAPCAHVSALLQQHLQDIDHRLAELAHTRQALLTLVARAAAVDPDACDSDSICTILATDRHPSDDLALDLPVDRKV